MTSSRNAIAMSRRLVLSGLAAAVVSPAMARAWQITGDWIPQLAGRWDVIFTVPAGDLATVWVIEQTPSGATSIATVGPNPMALALRETRLIGSTLRLSGPTSTGEAILQAALAPDRLEGSFTAGDLGGSFVATRRSDVRSHTVIEMFDQSIATFEEMLFTPAPFDAAWAARKGELRATLEEATERDLVRVVRTLIASAGLSHNDYVLEPTPPLVVDLVHSEPSISWRRLSGGAGYLRMASFVEDPAARQELDGAFADLAATRGFVVDLRGNSGGNLGLAMRLGDHLFPTQTTVGAFATRRALDAAGVAGMDALPDDAYAAFSGYEVEAFQDALTHAGAVRIVTGGRAPAAYAQPVALLVDSRCASTTEAMAAVIKESGRARLFGSTTAGRMLSSRRLPVLDGYTLRVAYADFRTPGGANIEGVGVAPDQITGAGDAAVRAATSWLRSQR
ncbi:MAG: hypothetical protein J0L52_11005 [Caulobacterales bacterium]|nr:hypothetical protein [Caulobacterales bacterium]